MGLVQKLHRALNLAWVRASSRWRRDPSRAERRRRRAWQRGTGAEIRFWRSWVRKGGAKWRADFEERLDPHRPLQDYVSRWLPHDQARVSILDVGAGPLTVLGSVWGDREVDLRAVDALADDYRLILSEQRITPHVVTQTCPTEALTELFDEDSFDVVHARNTLDHHHDVVPALRQMIAVTKPGGYLVLRHRTREGEKEGYLGLHQWDLFIEGDDYVISNVDHRTTVNSELGAVADIVELARVERYDQVVIRKKRE